MTKKAKPAQQAPAKPQPQTALPEGVVPFAQYEIAKADPKELGAMIHDGIGNLGISEFDLDRIVVPTGGGLAWQIAGLDAQPEILPSFDAVVLAYKHTRAYYAISFDESGGGSPPDCSSNDGATGKGDPGGDCETCEFAKFGSSEKPGGRAQACTQNLILFIVRHNDLIPNVLKIPPTSIKAAKQYLMRLVFKKRTRHWHALTRFSLKEAKNKSGIGYSAVVMQYLGTMSGNERFASDKIHQGITPLVLGLKTGGAAFLPSPDQVEQPRLLEGEPEDITPVISPTEAETVVRGQPEGPKPKAETTRMTTPEDESIARGQPEGPNVFDKKKPEVQGPQPEAL